MTETFARELQCSLCQETYSPEIEAPEGKPGYKVYCSSCPEWFAVLNNDPVRITLKEVLGLQGEALALAMQSVLNNCLCGSEFTHDGGKRCPVCLRKIQRETRSAPEATTDFRSPWKLDELKKLEAKAFGYIFDKIESKEENLSDLIQKFDAGEIDAEVYMEAVESLPYREARLMAVIQTWAMSLGPELAFRAAEEHDLVEKFGTRILITIAQGIELISGQAILSSLAKEKDHWGGSVEKELATFITKIGGGF
jgi:hypothetical protein